jgi:CRP/FNR family transcriptional regulator
MNDITVLKNISVFSQLADEQLMEISELESTKPYKKGHIVFSEMEKGEAFYFIKSGKVKVYKTSFDGREVILNIFGAGSIVAEVTMFNDIDYPATAEVIEDAEIGMIFNRDIEKLVMKNHGLALQIIKQLSKRLYRSQMNVKEMALNDVSIRTAKVLLQLAKKYGKKAGKTIEIDLDVTRQDLANLVGTTRETLSRTMSQFKKKRYINIKDRKIIICDQQQLEEIIE